MGLDGVASRRDLAGETCVEVVEGIALAAALAIDPQAIGTAEPAAAALDGGSDSSPVPTGAPAASIQSPSVPDRSVDEPSPSEPPAVPTDRWRWAAGVDAQAVAGLAPGALGGGVFVDVARTGAGPLVPSFRISLHAMATQASFTGGIGASLLWRIARAEVCPVRLVLHSLATTACLELDAGSLTSEGSGLAKAATDSRPWIVPGALARAAWPYSEGFWVEGAAGLGVPLDRYTFDYQQGLDPKMIEVYRMPPVGAELGLAAGYRFP